VFSGALVLSRDVELPRGTWTLGEGPHRHQQRLQRPGAPRGWASQILPVTSSTCVFGPACVEVNNIQIRSEKERDAYPCIRRHQAVALPPVSDVVSIICQEALTRGGLQVQRSYHRAAGQGGEAKVPSSSYITHRHEPDVWCDPYTYVCAPYLAELVAVFPTFKLQEGMPDMKVGRCMLKPAQPLC